MYALPPLTFGGSFLATPVTLEPLCIHEHFMFVHVLLTGTGAPSARLVLRSTVTNSILLVHYVTHECDKERGRENNGPEAEFLGQTGLKNGCVTLDRVLPSMSAVPPDSHPLDIEGAQDPPEGLMRDYVVSLSSQQWPGTEHFTECQLLPLSLSWTPSGAGPKHTIAQTQKAESPSSRSLRVW